MPANCTALATKLELEAVESLIGDKLDKDEEPQIIQASVGLAVPAAAALLIPKIDDVLAKIAAVAGRVGELFGKLGGIVSVLATLATLISVAQLTYEVSVLRSDLTAVKKIAEGAASRADLAQENANEAIKTGNTAITTTEARVTALEQGRTNDKVTLNQLSIGLDSAIVRIPSDEDIKIVRTVAATTTTNAAGIRDLDGKLIGLGTQIGGVVSSFSQTLTTTIGQAQTQTKQEIKDYIGALPGIGTGTGTGAITEAKVKDIAKAEIQTQLGDRATVEDKQYQKLLDSITGVAGLVGTGVAIPGGAGISSLSTGIQTAINQTTRASLSTGAQAGICQSLNGAGCAGSPIQGLSGANNLLNNNLNGINAVLGTADLLQGANILNIVKNTNQAVRHASYGLQKVQDFASTAWRAATNDKVLNGLSLIVGLHNAVMLSNNIASTLGDTVSIGLGAFGIKDAEDNLIDVNGIIKAKLTSLITSVIGTENYAQLTATLTKVNRIYQAGQNILSTVTSLGDNAREIAEETGEHVAVVGNALRQSGVLEYDAFPHLNEDIRRNNGVFKRLDAISNVTDAIYSITDEVNDLSENLVQLKGERNEFKEAIDKAKSDKTKEEEKEESRIDSLPATQEADKAQSPDQPN